MGADLEGTYPNPDIGPLTVGGRELKDDAVAANHVLDDTLTGADIDESTLSGVTAAPSGPAGGGLAGTYPNPFIGGNAVGSANVANDTLTGDDVENDSLGSLDLGPDSVGGSELADDSVGSAHVNDDSLTGDDVDEDSLDLDLMRVSGSSADNSNAAKSATANCPAGTFLVGMGGVVATSGGFLFPPDVVIAGTEPTLGQGAVAHGLEVADGNANSWHVTAHAICAGVAG